MTTQMQTWAASEQCGTACHFAKTHVIQVFNFCFGVLLFNIVILVKLEKICALTKTGLLCYSVNTARLAIQIAAQPRSAKKRTALLCLSRTTVLSEKAPISTGYNKLQFWRLVVLS